MTIKKYWVVNDLLNENEASLDDIKLIESLNRMDLGKREFIKVLKLSDLKKEIEEFEKVKLITAGGIETGFYLDVEDWQQFKKNILGSEKLAETTNETEHKLISPRRSEKPRGKKSIWDRISRW